MARRDNQPTVWGMAPHTAAKHELLRTYLGAWYAILGTRHSRIVFIDGFAGPGVYDGGEPGSPAIAVRTLLDHYHFSRMGGTEFVFVFNEEDPERFEQLKAVVTVLETSGTARPQNVTIHLSNQPFEELAEEIIDSLDGATMAPTFAFLDPFGFSGVSIDLIGELLASDRSELFIYFHQNGVNRFANAGNVDQHMLALFGTDEYMNAPPAGDPARGRFFHDLYAQQLRDRARYPFVRSFEMVTASGHTGHYLFFCTRSLTGLKKMKAAMWKLAPLGNFRFSDASTEESVLFVDNPNLTPLEDLLVSHFSGHTVLVEQISDFVAEHTPYTDSHFKKPLKQLQAAGLITSDNQRRLGTFPDGTRVTFRS